MLNDGSRQVPGCGVGGPGDWRGDDYCFDPNDDTEWVPTPPLSWLGRDACNATTPCERCSGDCDTDSDCSGNLECFQRGWGETFQVPGCGFGGPDDHMNAGDDYCFDPNNDTVSTEPPGVSPTLKPTPAPTLILLTRDSCNATTPCQRCSGDCDVDNDCSGNLKCYQRGLGDTWQEMLNDGSRQVPGCGVGGPGDWRGDDYCFDPNDDTEWVPTPPLSWLGRDACNATTPCERCSGDCDTDSDCSGNLECFQRGWGETFQVPGCGFGGPGDHAGDDYCFEPNEDDVSTDGPTVSPTGKTNSKTIQPSSAPSMNSSQTYSPPKIIASFDADMHAPRCATSSSCSSGALLVGVGILGPEPNAPNTIDNCEGEGSNFTSLFRHDESVDRIIVRATNEEIIAAGNEIEIEVTLSSANDTSKRSIPNKWSVAHVYYASNATIGKNNISWEFITSHAVEPGSGEDVFTVQYTLPAQDSSDKDGDPDGTARGDGRFPLSAIRVTFGYSQYRKNPCPSDVIEDLSYLDVDDLVFQVASADSSKSIAPTTAPSQVITNSASSGWNGLWIVLVAVLLSSYS